MSSTANESARQQEAHLALQIDHFIGKHKGELIRDLQGLADSYEIGKVSERAPLKNVMSVANEANSDPEEVINFIRYQLGRSTRNEIWSRQSKGNQPKNVFADELATRIENLSKMSDKILESILKNVSVKVPDRDQVHIKLIRLYLGYLSRYHTYLKWAYEQERIKGGR
ncbi:MAG: hypothetical protein L0229_09010 [Blastocatellia bacterium]|nr:hypothetical protein [Blastocatellia bacterium]